MHENIVINHLFLYKVNEEKRVFMGKAKNGSKEVIAKTSWKKSFKRDWQLYLLLLFPLAMVFVFSYAAYPGMRMAFMDYKPIRGYAGSDWVGFAMFKKIFTDSEFTKALRNSIVFNLLDLLIGFPM